MGNEGRERRLWRFLDHFTLSAGVISILFLCVLLYREHGGFTLLRRVEEVVFEKIFLPRTLPPPGTTAPSVVGIAVDQGSLDILERRYGRWPWSRQVWQQLVDYVSSGKPRAVLFDLLFTQPNLSDPDGVFTPSGEEVEAGAGDWDFADAIEESGRVYLPYHFSPGDGQGSFSVSSEAAAFLDACRPILRPTTRDPSGGGRGHGGAVCRYETGRPVDWPFSIFLRGCRGVGWIDAEVDGDGLLRRSALLVSLPGRPGRFWPSLPLAAVWREEPGLLSVDSSGRLYRKGRPLPCDPDGMYRMAWRGGWGGYFRVYPLWAVLRSYEFKENGRLAEALKEDWFVAPEAFEGRYVVVGTAAGGLADIKPTPLSSESPGMTKHMVVIDALLRGDFLRRAPAWLCGLLLVLLPVGTARLYSLSRSLPYELSLYLSVSCAYLGFCWLLFSSASFELDVVIVETALLATFLVTILRKYFLHSERERLIRNMFQKYMSPELVARLMENPDSVKPGGERRILTVFFSDLANFTSMSEQLEPERLVVLINEYLSLMTEDIIRCGGYLDKYQGDGIMAVFGVYTGASDHAYDACRAALANVAGLRRLNERWRSRGIPEAGMRIGINTGPMIAGNVGSEAKMNYTVVGDAVNLASRLESANKIYRTSVMISEETRKAAGERIIARELDLIAVKGKQHGVRVYELVALAEEPPDERVLTMLELYDSAMRCWKERRWKEALAAFEAVLEVVPGDGPSLLYVERCRRFVEEPPPEDWDGIFRLTSK